MLIALLMYCHPAGVDNNFHLYYLLLIKLILIKFNEESELNEIRKVDLNTKDVKILECDLLNDHGVISSNMHYSDDDERGLNPQTQVSGEYRERNS